MKRAKELLSIQEPIAAARELKIALKAKPNDDQSKALLLVAIERADDDLPAWYESQIVFERHQALADSAIASTDAYADLGAFVKDARQKLYDKGLDTKDATEMWALSQLAARYSLREASDDRERDYAAFVLALHNEEDGIAHLIERLKSEKAQHIPGLIARLDGAGEDALIAMAVDREALGRPRALTALAALREQQAAAEIFGAALTLRGLSLDDLPSDLRWRAAEDRAERGLTRSVASYGLEIKPAAKSVGLRAFRVSFDREGARQVFLYQAYDEQERSIVTTFYRFDEGALRKLALDAPGDLVKALAREGAIMSMRHVEGGLQLLQVGRGERTEWDEVKRSRFARGDRVRVRSIGIDGRVEGIDEYGLMSVRLDRPHRGQETITQTPNGLRGLVEKRVPGTIDRELFAKISDTTLSLAEVADSADEQ